MRHRDIQTDTPTPLGLNTVWYYRAHRIMRVNGFAVPNEKVEGEATLWTPSEGF